MKKSIFGCWTNSACSPICPAETEAAREKSASSKRTDGREHLVLPGRTTPRSKSGAAGQRRVCATVTKLRGMGRSRKRPHRKKAARRRPLQPTSGAGAADRLLPLGAGGGRCQRNCARGGHPFFEKTKRRGGRAASRPPRLSAPRPVCPCGAFLPRSGHCWVPSFPGASPRLCRPPRDRPRTGPLLSLIFSSRFPPSCTLLSAHPVRPAPPLSAPPRSGPATLIAAPRAFFRRERRLKLLLRKP